MSINERFYKIDQLLNDKHIVSFDELREVLEVSPATLKRDLAYMRDRLKAPIVYDKSLGGYKFAPQTLGETYELPGLWFSAEEIYALLSMQHLLSEIDSGGLLGPHIKPLQSRFLALLGSANNAVDEVRKRVKVEVVGARHFNLKNFQEIGSALLQRKRIEIEYFSRSTNQLSVRELSPQRIVYYRNNWYLDAWCHLRSALRSFSIDSIKRVHINIIEAAKDLSEVELNETLGSGYGIFSGKEIDWAILKFNPKISRWVANEVWHPKQKGRYLEDGFYELTVPFSNNTELIMDIIKYADNVSVIAPKELRDEIIKQLKNALAYYDEQLI